MSLAADFLREGFGPRPVATVDQDLRAGSSEPGRDVAANAVGRARDQYRLAGHFHLDTLFFILTRFLHANRDPLRLKTLYAFNEFPPTGPAPRGASAA